jgi:hypothetical protein
LTPDDVLDNVTLTQHVCLCAASLLGGFEKEISFFGVKGVSASVGLSVFSATEARPLQQALANTLRPGSSRSSSQKKSAPGSVDALTKWKWRPVGIICDFKLRNRAGTLALL